MQVMLLAGLAWIAFSLGIIVFLFVVDLGSTVASDFEASRTERSLRPRASTRMKEQAPNSPENKVVPEANP